MSYNERERLHDYIWALGSGYQESFNRLWCVPSFGHSAAIGGRKVSASHSIRWQRADEE